MGFKFLLLLTIFVLMAIFSLQNLQSISLVFFSFNSLTLPLSIWIILSLLAGIISSLIIQFLSNNFQSKNNYSQSLIPEYPDDYPPSPPVKERTLRQKQKDIASSQYRFTSQVNDLNSEEESNILDDRQTQYSNRREAINDNLFTQKQSSPPITNINKSSPETPKIKNILENQDINFQKPKTPDINVSFPVPEKSPAAEDIPSPAWLKSRDASLYSYQPREKTQVKTTPDKIESDRHRLKKPSPGQNPNGIYDASYRVISPSQERINQDDDFSEDDEDWDF